MQKRLTMEDRARLWDKLGYRVTNSRRKTTIWLRHVTTGEINSEEFPQEMWDDEYCQRAYEMVWAEDGFEVVEGPQVPSCGYAQTSTSGALKKRAPHVKTNIEPRRVFQVSLYFSRDSRLCEPCASGQRRTNI